MMGQPSIWQIFICGRKEISTGSLWDLESSQQLIPKSWPWLEILWLWQKLFLPVRRRPAW